MSSAPNERSGWLGPLFFWDIITQGRQRHLHIYRVAYAALLLVMLYFILGRTELTVTNVASVAAQAMYWVLLLQFCVVILLTPVFVAGIVLDERRRGTLTLLLTTFLTTREIVVGKLAARLLSVLSVVLAGVPVIAILQFLGGVDFVLTVLLTLHAFIVMALIAMYSLHASLSCKTTPAAILKSYSLLAVNVLFGSCVAAPVAAVVVLVTDLPFWTVELVLVHVFYFLLASLSLAKTLKIVGRRDFDVLTDQALELAAYETPVQEWKSLARALRITRDRYGPVDPFYLINSPLAQSEPGLIAVRYYRVPDVWDRCLVWKEAYLPMSRTGYQVATMGSLLLGLSLLLVSLVLRSSLAPTSAEYNTSFRFVSGALMLTPLLVIGLRAAGCVAEEHEQRTLSSLLSTPMARVWVLGEKWLGCFWRFRLLLAVTGLLLVNFCFNFPLRAWLVLPLYAVQLAFFSALALFLSAALAQPHRARMAFAVILLLCVFVLPVVHRVLFGPVTSATPPVDLEATVLSRTVLMITSPIEAWTLWQVAPVDPIDSMHPVVLDWHEFKSWYWTLTALLLLTAVLFGASVLALHRLKEHSA